MLDSILDDGDICTELKYNKCYRLREKIEESCYRVDSCEAAQQGSNY